MPTYDYRCPACGDFEVYRSMSERNVPARCPECGEESPRVLVAAPRLSAVAAGTRGAIEANERAANEPMSSRDLGGHSGRMRHPAGCGCCSGGGSRRRESTSRAPDGAKSFPSKRPWMISH